MSERNEQPAPAAPPSTSATPSSTSTQHQDPQTSIPPQATDSKLKHKPFPTVTGGCICNKIRYRLLKSPLFCYACHCPDCQRSTGSAFGLFLNIESTAIRIISPTAPVAVSVTRRPATNLVSRHVECPVCKCELWSTNMLGPAISDVRVGTLDYPSLMEPDVHSFVESKLEWVRVPEGATVATRGFEHRKLWPEASLRRLDIALEQFAKRAAVVAAAAAAAKGGAIAEESQGADVGGDGEKTPTAGEFGVEGEDDEAFEKRFRETERMLQERLEKLSMKLAEEDGGKRRQSHLEDMTANLEINDSKDEGKSVDAVKKDGIVAPPVD